MHILTGKRTESNYSTDWQPIDSCTVEIMGRLDFNATAINFNLPHSMRSNFVKFLVIFRHQIILEELVFVFTVFDIKNSIF